MEKAKTAIGIRLKCVCVQSEWCWSTGQITPRSGRRSARLRRRLAAQAETLRGWVRQAERDSGLAGWADQRRAGADEGAGAGDPRAAPGQ